jgi:hypothetical protein
MLLVTSLSFQQGFSVKAWAGIIDDYVTGLYNKDRLSKAPYADYFNEKLTLLLTKVSLHACEGMWFLHNCTLSNSERRVHNWLDNYFPDGRTDWA